MDQEASAGISPLLARPQPGCTVRVRGQPLASAVGPTWISLDGCSSALDAEAAVAKVTKPKPLDRPWILSITTAASST